MYCFCSPVSSAISFLSGKTEYTERPAPLSIPLGTDAFVRAVGGLARKSWGAPPLGARSLRRPDGDFDFLSPRCPKEMANQPPRSESTTAVSARRPEHSRGDGMARAPLICRPSPGIGQFNQLPGRILRCCQRTLRMRGHNLQDFATTNALNGQTLTLHRQHSVSFVKDFPLPGLHTRLGCQIPSPRSPLNFEKFFPPPLDTSPGSNPPLLTPRCIPPEL